jgi:hypothetical protein
MKNEIVGFYFDPKNPKTNVACTFQEKDVIGLTMAPDGATFANLKGFRQARIRYNDYMNLKEKRDAQPA